MKVKTKNTTPARRRRNYRWTSDEIDRLIDWRLIEFLPDREIPEEPGITEAEQRRHLASLAKKLDGEALVNAEAELKRLRRLKLEGEERDRELYEAAKRLDRSPINDLSVITRLYSYLRASLGLHPCPEQPADLKRPEDPQWLLHRRLENTAQEECLLRWVGLTPAIWNYLAWRECLWMRYEGGDRISESGYFERLAVKEARRQRLSAQKRTSYVDQFCRYLKAPQGHADELIGSVLYQLLRLQAKLWEDPQNSPPEMPGIKWPSQLKPERVRISKDYRLLTERFAAPLEVDPRILKEIAQAYVALRLRQFWQQRANVTMTVFWGARILEGLHLDAYKVYGQWIDFFHVRILRPFLRTVKKEAADGGYIKATLGPFFRALQTDPLLNCVFHSEIFGGRDRLFVASSGKRDDERIRSVIATYAVHRLRKARGKPPQLRVSELLPDDLPIRDHVRAAAQITNRSTRIRGRSHYAYVAPLITALIDDPLVMLTADSVKDTFHNHERDPEVVQLLTNLPRIAAASTRG